MSAGQIPMTQHRASTGASGYDDIAWSAPPISRLVGQSTEGVKAIRHLGCEGSGIVQTRSRGDRRPDALLLARRPCGIFEGSVDGRFKSTSLTRDLCSYLPHGVSANLEYPALSQGLILHFPPGHLARHVDEGMRNRLEPAPVFRNRDLAVVMLMIEQELANPGFGQDLLLDGLCRCIAIWLAREFGGVTALKTDRIHISVAKVRRVIDYVESNLGNRILIEDMANVAGISKWHFARAFKKSTGQSPYQFVKSRRLLRAQSLIERCDSSLADIALQCGFANQAHFTTAFNQEMGMPPGRFKQLQQEVAHH